MSGYPIDYIPDRPSKRDEKRLIQEMGEFADFMERLNESHEWNEKIGDFVRRGA